MKTNGQPRPPTQATREQWRFIRRAHLGTDPIIGDLGDYYLWVAQDHTPFPRHYAMPIEQFWAQR